MSAGLALESTIKKAFVEITAFYNNYIMKHKHHKHNRTVKNYYGVTHFVEFYHEK